MLVEIISGHALHCTDVDINCDSQICEMLMHQPKVLMVASGQMETICDVFLAAIIDLG